MKPTDLITFPRSAFHGDADLFAHASLLHTLLKQHLERNRGVAPDDLLVWPDGTFCYGDELGEMRYMSDDFEIVRAGSGSHQLLSNYLDPLPPTGA